MSTLAIAGCKGACVPAPGGSAIDLYHARILLELRQPALATIEKAWPHCSGWLRSFLAGLQDTIAGLPHHEFVAVFKPSVAFFDLHPLVIERDPVRAALSLLRFVVGGPNLRATAFVIPQQAIPDGGLYLPHLNVVLAGGCGPVAAQAVGGNVRLTWADGLAVDVPSGGGGEPSDAQDRLLVLPSVSGWPILNAIVEAHDPILAVLPAPAAEIPARDLEALEAGHDLLQEVWPLGHAATRRFLHSAILQPTEPDHTTSVTLDFLQGTFIASCRDAVQVADALVHEGSHARLALLLRADPLILNDDQPRFDSPWRGDKRPLKGLLNGVHAFLNVALFYRRLAQQRPDLAAYASEIHDVQRRKVKEGWDTCVACAEPTAVGRGFLDELGREVERL